MLIFQPKGSFVLQRTGLGIAWSEDGTGTRHFAWIKGKLERQWQAVIGKLFPLLEGGGIHYFKQLFHGLADSNDQKIFAHATFYQLMETLLSCLDGRFPCAPSRIELAYFSPKDGYFRLLRAAQRFSQAKPEKIQINRLTMLCRKGDLNPLQEEGTQDSNRILV